MASPPMMLMQNHGPSRGHTVILYQGAHSSLIFALPYYSFICLYSHALHQSRLIEWHRFPPQTGRRGTRSDKGQKDTLQICGSPGGVGVGKGLVTRDARNQSQR
ncbi:hypothetical protein EJ02DRAFT_175525 [Clathrospora elynae]|uniref:Uncharacterized protein n=1 Tax=Clathrospora elynae TaxID=706981 RepID=A0A6A5SUN7_9PLEO|nr:hypothetical protein EJ02DRAFT_175525 [Clathrospora elynae]